MTKENLLKFKEIYEKNGDTENLQKVLKNLETYEPKEENVLEKISANKKGKK